MNSPDLRIVNDKTEVVLLYRMMRIRAVEEAVAARYSQWKMRCPTHLCSGQEAVPAAVGMVLGVNDPVVGSHRSHGHYLGKGGDLSRMLAELYGKQTGCSKGRGGSMHLIDKKIGFLGCTAIVAGTIPVGVGLALASQQRKLGQVCGIFFGDCAVEEGVFYESLNFAALRRLPVLFVCENNRYAVYTPLQKRQPPHRTIHAMVAGIGVHAAHGDGNDPLGVYQMVLDSVNAIRQGDGPRFLEFDTYRLREHCGPNKDDDLGYRPRDELDYWLNKDPIVRLKTWLSENCGLREGDVDAMNDEIHREIEAAFLFAENSPFPLRETAFTGLYRE